MPRMSAGTRGSGATCRRLADTISSLSPRRRFRPSRTVRAGARAPAWRSSSRPMDMSPLRSRSEARTEPRHLQVRFDQATSSYTAFDMRSSNGTLLNGRPLNGDTPLKDGDELTLGKTVTMLFSNDVPADKPNAMEVLKKAGERRRNTLVK